jgi:hypothetical protein
MRRVLTMVRSTLRRRRVVAVLATFLVIVLGFGGGAAYAYFSSGGAGSGTASTGQPITVHVIPATATPTNTLIPGGTSDLALTLNNPNAYPVRIAAIESNGDGPDAGGGCTAANSGVTVPTQSGLSITVASGASVNVTIPDGATMSSSSASACQGKQLELPVLLTVQK